MPSARGRKRAIEENTGQVEVTGSCGHRFTLPWAYARECEVRREWALKCPTCKKMIAVTETHYGDRKCEEAGCTNRLAKGNPGPSCFTCRADRNREVARKQGFLVAP